MAEGFEMKNFDPDTKVDYNDDNFDSSGDRGERRESEQNSREREEMDPFDRDTWITSTSTIDDNYENPTQINKSERKINRNIFLMDKTTQIMGDQAKEALLASY